MRAGRGQVVDRLAGQPGQRIGHRAGAHAVRGDRQPRRPVPGRDVVAAPWVPDASLVEPRFVWAALDCPGAYATGVPGRGTVVLGRLAADVRRVPRAGERCVVVGWSLGDEGRKHHAGTALFGEDGDVLGVGRALWIEPK